MKDGKIEAVQRPLINENNALRKRVEKAEARSKELELVVSMGKKDTDRVWHYAGELKARLVAESARAAELESAVKALLPHHSGSCCTFDASGKVIVTQTSCKCPEHVHLARILVGEWPGDSAGTPSLTDHERDVQSIVHGMGGCGAIEVGRVCIQNKDHAEPCFGTTAEAREGEPRSSTEGPK